MHADVAAERRRSQAVAEGNRGHACNSFELNARQTSASTKNIAANELTWFAIEVVE